MLSLRGGEGPKAEAAGSLGAEKAAGPNPVPWCCGPQYTKGGTDWPPGKPASSPGGVKDLGQLLHGGGGGAAAQLCSP